MTIEQATQVIRCRLFPVLDCNRKSVILSLATVRIDAYATSKNLASGTTTTRHTLFGAKRRSGKVVTSQWTSTVAFTKNLTTRTFGSYFSIDCEYGHHDHQ